MHVVKKLLLGANRCSMDVLVGSTPSKGSPLCDLSLVRCVDSPGIYQQHSSDRSIRVLIHFFCQAPVFCTFERVSTLPECYYDLGLR